MTRVSVDTISIHSVDMSSAVVLRGLGSASHELGINTVGPDTGNTYQEVRFLGEQRPVLNFTTPALKSILSNISLLTGKCITNDGTHPGLDLYGQAHDPCGTKARSASGSHMRVRAGKAHLFVTSIGGTRGQSAVATLTGVLLTSDGTSAPSSVIYNATLPTSFVFDEEYVIGAPTIAGYAVPATRVSSWRIDTGIDFEALINANAIWPGDVDVRKVAPRVSVTIDDASALSASKIPYSAKQATHIDTVFPLIRRNPYAGLRALTDTVHILITAAGLAHVTRHFDASGRATGTGEIMIECTEVSGTAPLVVTIDESIM